jgi:hypothetical protein
VNYRANIFALKKTGVKQLIGFSAVGSLREDIAPGDFAIPAQYIDWVKDGRTKTFFGNGVTAHVSTARPVCQNLVDGLTHAAQKAGATIHTGKTYVCVDGPRLGTQAESHFFRQIGGDLVGMTNVPEVFLARESQICYAIVGIATDYDCWKENPAGPSQFAYRTLSPEGAKRGIGAAAVAPRENSLEDNYLREVGKLRADQREAVKETRKYYDDQRKEITEPTAPDEEKIRRDMDARAEARDRPMIEAMRAQAASMRPNEEAAKRRAFQNFLIEGGAAMADPRNGGRGIAGALRAFTQAGAAGNRAYEREMTVMEAAKQKAMEAEQKVNEAQYKAATDRDKSSEAAVTNAMREFRTAQSGVKALHNSLKDRERAEIVTLAREFGVDAGALGRVYEGERRTAAAEAKQRAEIAAAEERERGRVAAAENKTLASQVQSVQKLVSDAMVKNSFKDEWKKLERDFRKQQDAGQQPTPLPRKEAWVLEKVLAANPNLFPDAASFAEAARKVSGRSEPQQPTAPAAAPAQQTIKLFP